MGISFGRDGGLRKTRDITSRSPKEITEVVTFVNRFYPRTVVKDGDWQICQVCSKEHKEDFVIKGTMVAMTNNDEYDTEYKIVARLEWDERREEWGYVVAYSQEIYEFKTVEDQKVFLRQILNDSQLESLFSMYPDPIKAIEEQGVDALIKIPRIGAKTAEKIVGRYDACKDKSKAYVELCKYGLTTNMVDRLVAHYKSPEVAITKVKENPYNLVIDVKGIGFRKADEIAMQLGFSETEPTRCIAFAHHFFQEKANEGDSYVEYDEFLKAVDETLGVDYPDESIDTAMGELNKQEKLWVKDCTDDDGYEYTLIGLKKYYETEKEIAFHLNRLLNRPNSTPIDREEAMKRIKEKEEQQGWKYTERQLEGIFTCMDNNISIIIGYGGTGKSSAVSGMLACMDEEFVFHQCALSGKASVNLKDITGEEGVTIHSLLGYTPEMNKFMHNEENQLETDLVILDEGSMVDIELALSLLRAIPDHAKLIILGDTNQLEAIGAGNFLLDMIESGQIPLVVFDKVHRQGAKSAIKTESIKVAEGQQLVKRGWTGTEVLGELKDLKYIGFEHPYKSTEKRPSIDLIMTEFKELFKKADTIEDIVVTVPTRSNGTGCYPLNIKIQEYVLPRNRGIGLELGTEKEPFTVYVGDKVINLQNNRKTYYYDKVINEFGEEVVDKVTRPIYNGNVGEVVEIDVKDQSMVVDFYNVGKVLIKGKQLQQINLGYAITVHKLQGSTIPYVVGCVDFTHYSMLNRQLVYTLMSRAKYELRFVFETNALVKAIATNKVSTKRTFLYHFLCGLLD